MHFKGSLLGFVEGDSQFAVFCVSGDSILTVGVSSPDAANFAAAHAGAMLDIEAEVIDIYEENGIVSPVYGMTDAAMGAYTAKKWSGEMVRALGYDRASKALLALEQSMILDREPARCRN